MELGLPLLSLDARNYFLASSASQKLGGLSGWAACLAKAARTVRPPLATSKKLHHRYGDQDSSPPTRNVQNASGHHKHGFGYSARFKHWQQRVRPQALTIRASAHYITGGAKECDGRRHPECVRVTRMLPRSGRQKSRVGVPAVRIRAGAHERFLGQMTT